MLLRRKPISDARLAGPAQRILELQAPDGAIPWFENGPWDSWNHAECVMALAIVGEESAARAGLDALANAQRADGGFLSDYGNALPMADHVSIARVAAVKVLDTNFSAYVATAVEHFGQVFGLHAAAPYWPMVRDALDHVLACQHPEGDVSWCVEAHRTELDDALLAGNASICASLGHGADLAEALGEPRPDWRAAQALLAAAIRARPDRFDRSGTPRGGFAMDWYYPVLAAAIAPEESAAHLRAHWPRFVDPGLGCRCVAHEPWVTVAESCELVIAALHSGLREEAAALLDWIEERRDESGVFWMGWQHVEGIDWPAERPSWTQAAYILALDAIEELSPASGIFAR